MNALNLSRRPFVNSRPIRRLAVLLWSVGGLLFLVNIALYGRYQAGFAEGRSRRLEVDTKIEQEKTSIADRRTTLLNLRLERQNRQVAFLNQKIAERTFPWSVLFERLGEVLPDKVRLYSLGPRVLRPSRVSRGNSPREDERVSLSIAGAAEDDEALLEMVDAFFAHPSFENPKLHREAREHLRLIRFDLHVTYLPGSATAPQRPGVTERAVLREGPRSSPKHEDAGPPPGGAPVSAGRSGKEPAEPSRAQAAPAPPPAPAEEAPAEPSSVPRTRALPGVRVQGGAAPRRSLAPGGTRSGAPAPPTPAGEGTPGAAAPPPRPEGEEGRDEPEEEAPTDAEAPTPLQPPASSPPELE